MSKIKGQGTLTKLITSKLAASNRNRFSALVRNSEQLKQIVKRVDNSQGIQSKLVSYSSSRDYPEQILSILSFLRHAGTPLSWTIYSDGSHTEEEIKVIQTSIPFVQVIRQDINGLTNDTGKLKLSLYPCKHELRDFALNHPLGKKLYFYLNHSIDSNTIFLDSDVLFYAKFSRLKGLFASVDQGLFLPEKWGELDARYILGKQPDHYQVNAGFFLVNSELPDLSEGLRFLRDIKHVYEYFTEQTVLHILLTSNRYKPLDPTLFVVNACDQFDFSYAFTRDDIAMRHYTGPVRHKMWQRDWKWQLSLT